MKSQVNKGIVLNEVIQVITSPLHLLSFPISFLHALCLIEITNKNPRQGGITLTHINSGHKLSWA